MFFQYYPFLKIFTPFLSGILLKSAFPETNFISIPLLTVLSCLYLIIFYTHKKNKTFLLFIYATFFLLSGIAIRSNYLPGDQHLVNQPGLQAHSYSCSVANAPQSISGYQRMEVAFKHFYTSREIIPVKGKGTLWIKDNDKPELLPGDHLLIKGQPKPIPGPDLPGGFNFKSFYAHKNIFHQHFISPKDILKYEKGGFSLRRFACIINRKAQKRLEESLDNEASLQIASALLLGNRWNVEKDIKKMYANSGLMHILAISGLHVGILYGILVHLLKPFIRSGNSRVVTIAIILLFLWGYAFVTGLSVSVIRATLLFTLFGIQTLLRRKSRGAWNLLAFAAFILLLYDPGYIHSIGFQFSFLAVGSIIYFQPRMAKWFRLKGLIRHIWELAAVSIAAQFALLPLSLYYFHQFPTWFLPANLLIVPFLGIILYLGLATLLLNPLPFAGTASAFLFSKCIWSINQITTGINHLPATTLGPFYPSFTEVTATYLIIIMLLFAFRRKNFKGIYAAGAFLIVFSIAKICTLYTQEEKQHIIVLNTKPVCWIITDGYSACIASENMPSQKKQTIHKELRPYLTRQNIRHIRWENLNAPYFLKGTLKAPLRLYRHKHIYFGIMHHLRDTTELLPDPPPILYLKYLPERSPSGLKDYKVLLTKRGGSGHSEHLKNLHCLFTDGYLILTL